jgi:shikimate dehydrogenase
VAGLASLGLWEVELMVREPARAAGTAEVAERFGLAVTTTRWDPEMPTAPEVDVLVSTVPSGAVDDCADAVARAALVLDVVYTPWPTPVARAVAAVGGRLATGLDMLLHQAFGQVEQFTGRPAPRAEMAAALRSATG